VVGLRLLLLAFVRVTMCKPGSAGGRAVVAKYGREYMVALGRKGGRAFVTKYYASGVYARRLLVPVLYVRVIAKDK